MSQDDVNQQLIEAIKKFNVSSARKALADGADPNTIASGITIATQVSGRFRSNPYVVELLFGEGSYVGGKRVRSEVEPIFLALIENGLDLTISVRDRPLIVTAASEGLDACVCALLEKGADVNAIDFELGTAMHFAVRDCRMETIKMMVQRGADLNALDIEGLPPLNSLAADERLDVVSFLRSKGAKKLTYISPNVERMV